MNKLVSTFCLVLFGIASVNCSSDGGELFSTNSSTSSGSNSSSSGMDSGSSCIPKITCQSVSAECGIIKDDGCGNTIDCGDPCQSPLYCGGGKEQFKCGCTSKNCLTQGVTCGIIDDGCGIKLDCTGDLNTDAKNCGSCGYDCKENLACVGGKCDCSVKKTSTDPTVKKCFNAFESKCCSEFEVCSNDPNCAQFITAYETCHLQNQTNCGIFFIADKKDLAPILQCYNDNMLNVMCP